MALVRLKNYDDSFQNYNLYVPVVSAATINHVGNLSVYVDSHNNSWHISKTASSGNVEITIASASHIAGLTDEWIVEMLEGLDLAELFSQEYNLVEKLSSGDNFRLGIPDPGPAVAYPYIRIKRTDTHPNPQNHTISMETNFQFTSSYGFTYGGQVNILDTPGCCSEIIAIKDGNTFVYASVMFSFFHYTDGSSGNIKIAWNTTGYLTSDWADLDYDPGDKGFKPTAEYTKNEHPGYGGRPANNKKNPEYTGDSITQPGAPDESVASAVGSGFINCYQMDSTNLHKVGQCLYGSTLLGLIQSLSLNPLDFIISLMVFPCTPDVGSSENVKLGGWVAAATGGAALGFDATGTKLSKQFKIYDFGTISVPENWGNFLDYSQTAVELYLPFIGSINLDVSECMGGTVNVQYTVDFFTGMCVANVLCTKAGATLPSGKVLSNVHAQHSFQGNCAVQIPLSSINYGSMVGSLINACTQGITNPVQGFAGITADAIGGGFRPNVTSKGNIVANAGFCSVLYPYIRLTRPITAEPVTYQEVIGYPSYINTSLGMCEGLCVCDDIDLSGIVGATDSELERMRQLCMDGVIV